MSCNHCPCDCERLSTLAHKFGPVLYSYGSPAFSGRRMGVDLLEQSGEVTEGELALKGFDDLL